MRVKAASIGPLIPQTSCMSFGYPGKTDFSFSSKKYFPGEYSQYSTTKEGDIFYCVFISINKIVQLCLLFIGYLSHSPLKAYIEPFLTCMKESKGLPLHTSASGSLAFVGFGSAVVVVLTVVIGSVAIILSGNGVVAGTEIVGFASVGVNRLETSAKVSEDRIRGSLCNLETPGTSVLFVSSS